MEYMRLIASVASPGASTPLLADCATRAKYGVLRIQPMSQAARRRSRCACSAAASAQCWRSVLSTTVSWLASGPLCRTSPIPR